MKELLPIIISIISLGFSISTWFYTRHKTKQKTERDYIENLRNSIVKWQYDKTEEKFSDILYNLNSLSRYYNDHGYLDLAQSLLPFYNDWMQHGDNSVRSMISVRIQQHLNKRFPARNGSCRIKKIVAQKN